MNMKDFETCKPNKEWTKYLTETKKILNTQRNYQKQKGLKDVKVLDIYTNDEHTKSVIIDTKTNEIIEELPSNNALACHQMDFIRLQNELDNLDKIEKPMKENIFTRIWKPMRILGSVLIMILLMLWMWSCDSEHDNKTYTITNIELVDSTVRQNVLDKCLGIPTQIRTTYNYQVTLMDNDSVENRDTMIIIRAGAKIKPESFNGMKVEIYNNELYEL